MADRSQNITINYKFNTAEIDRANAVLNRANQATNTLQAAGQKAGQQISTSYAKAVKPIEAMNIQLARLKTQISVSSDPKRVAELSSQYKTLKAQIDAANKSAFQTPKALKETQQATKSLSSQFGQLYTAARLFITAGIVKEVVSMSLNMATLSGNVEGVERAFNRAFPNAEAILGDLRRATNGTITDFDLMKKTLQATNLGVPVKELATFFEFANVRAQQTGESVEYLTDSIVTGLGRKSTRVIDNLGISATRLKEEFKGASLESLSVAEVTKGVSNIIRQEMDKMGGYVETSATTVQQLGVAWEELKTIVSDLELNDIIAFLTFGMAESEFTLTGHLKDLVTGLRDAAEAIKAGQQPSELFETRQRKEIAVISEREFAQRVLNGTREENEKAIQDEISALTKSVGVYAQERDAVDKTIATMKTLLTGYLNEDIQVKQNIQNQIDYIATKKENALIDQEILRLLQARLAAMKQEDEGVKDQITTIKTLKDELKSLQEQREEATSINNKPELDRLQREIILLEDRILKIADNIKWQKQWDHSKMLSALATETETENLKKFNDELDKLTEKMAGQISFSTGDLLNPDRDYKELIDVDAIEESLKEVANLIGRTATSSFDDQEEAETIPDSWWTRFRLAFKNGAEDSSNELQSAINDAMDDLKLGLVDITADQLNATREIELQNMKLRLNDLKKFFDDQIELAGNNEQAKRALRKREEKETSELNRQIFEKEKKTRRSQALIDGAAGVVKAFATYPWPAALIISALITAQTLSQIAIINKQRPGFAKGVIDLKGPGSQTSDSIPANLSRGESVMTAWETRHAGDVLKDIRAKKLDNKILKNLKQGREPVVSQQKFNDSNIIKAIEKNRPPDVIVQSGIVYEARTKGDSYRSKVRAKSVRL